MDQMPDFNRNAFASKTNKKKLAQGTKKKMKSIHGNQRSNYKSPERIDGGMNDSEQDRQMVRMMNSVDELEHRESDEGINDDNPNFNGNKNEFMFKKRQPPTDNQRRQAMDMNGGQFNPAGVSASHLSNQSRRQMMESNGMDDMAQEMSKRKHSHDSADELN